MNTPWPLALEFRNAARVLSIAFENGATFEIPFELLRVESPSAEARGHGGEHRPLVLGKANVGVRAAEPVGRYAVRIIFDDGHDTGLYSWDYLHELGANKLQRMSAYRARVEASETQTDA